MKLVLSAKNIIKYLILIIIFILVVLFLAFPNYSNLKTTYLNLIAEAKTLESKYITGEGLEKSSDDFQLISDQLPSYESLFIKRGEELLLVTKLEKLAEKYNLNQKLDLGLTRTELNENIIQVPFNFVIEGSFENFLGYLDTLYRMPYNLSIQNLNIKQTKDNKLEIHLLGYTYWLLNYK